MHRLLRALVWGWSSGLDGGPRLRARWWCGCLLWLVGGGPWLAAADAGLIWSNAPGFRVAKLVPQGSARVGFSNVPPEITGIRFTNVLPLVRHITNQIYLNGSGVTAGDLDGDGWCDLIFGGLGGRTTVYRNLGGWRFEDVTVRFGMAAGRLDVTGLTTADLDGDRDLDVLLNSVGQGTYALENLGDGRLRPFRNGGLLNAGAGGISMAVGDVDGDGDLDVYLANYRVSTSRDEPHLSFKISQEGGQPRAVAYGGRSLVEPQLTNRFKFAYRAASSGGGTVFHDEQGEADVFLRNEGSGRLVALAATGEKGMFFDETGRPLTEPHFDWGLSAMLRDLNGDGAPDLYVCNDFSSPDRIWINDGQGRFRALATNAIRQLSLSTMAVDVADFDRDGYDDIFTADMLSPERWRRLVQRNQANPNLSLFTDVESRPQVPRNMLQRNRGDGTYEEIARALGLEASDWSWASAFLDVDLDGYEDLLVANGFERDFMNMDANRRVRAAQARVARDAPTSARLAPNRLYPRLATPNLAFRNLGGHRFVDVSHEWGFDVAAVSQGMCFADLDNDGDLDVAINNLNGPASVLRNDAVAPRLGVRLRGNPPNTLGIGARIEVRGGAVERQTQEMIAGGRYLSGDDAMRVFAAGDGTTPRQLTVEVRWRNGRRSVVQGLAANSICEIYEESIAPGASPASASPPADSSATAYFIDQTSRLHHEHQSAVVDDFGQQTMLPARLSTRGPGVAWFDVDQDGWDDLILAGASGSPQWHRNDRQGGFVAEPSKPSTNSPPGRFQAAVGWRDSYGARLITSLDRSPIEGASTGGALQETRWLPGPEQTAIRELPLPAESPSPSATPGALAMADVDGDGDLDLFAGGQFVPGRWPEAANSMLWLQEQGQWVPSMSNTNTFRGLGLVNGAVFTDLDDDGDSDLVISREWAALQTFQNDGGRFTASDWALQWSPNIAGPAGSPAPSSFGRGSVQQLSQLTGWWTGVSAADFDGDGRTDLVAGNRGRNTDYERYLERPVRVEYGAFAGDDRVSIVEAVHDPALKAYAPLHDVWTMAASLPWLLAKYDSYEKFARATVDEVLSDHPAGRRRWEVIWPESTLFLNRGDHFTVVPLPAVSQRAPAWAVVPFDFDGDTRLDLFISQNFFGERPEASRHDAGQGLLLRGDGRGGFIALHRAESGLSILGDQRGAAAGDYDRDGRLDLVVAQHHGPTRLFRNAAAPRGLRVQLRGKPGNALAIGARLRLEDGRGWGPVHEIHAGSGYWSQESSTLVIGRVADLKRIQVRWPNGKKTEAPVPSLNEMELTEPD
jgi:hypothetical protein